MRVLIVNTSENTGGAAVASSRLMAALNNNGVKAKMLVRDKLSSQITVVGLKHGLRQQRRFLWERWCVFWHLHLHRDHLFEIDLANTGCDITHLPEYREADVIHLAWINQGMLSLKDIRRILRSGKPVVWTMHDMWPVTGICHYPRGCKAFCSACGNCPLLPGRGAPHDLSARVYKKKLQLYRNSNIRFVACSKWLEQQAKESRLMQGQRLTSIPNPIDTYVFHPIDKKEARFRAGLPQGKKVILFVSQRVTAIRKGMKYFVEAVAKLVAENPGLKSSACVAILGGHSEDIVSELALPAFPLGYVNEERKIVDIYNAADVYVLPSLEDNLPNTIMEAMACGVPCVGFAVGGIPEMIDHQKNGFLAPIADSAKLAEGIRWTLTEADSDELAHNAVANVVQKYSPTTVAMQYIELYNEAMALKNYHL